MSGWSIIPLDSKQGLGTHASAWDALNALHFASNPMLDSRFIGGLLQHFGDGSERLCIHAQNGVANAMCVLRPLSAGVWASFIPSQAQIGPTMVVAAQVLDDLIAALPGYVVRVDFLCNDPLNGVLAGASTAPSTHSDHALTVSIRLADSFSQYWAARSKSLVKNMSRYERRVRDDGITCDFRFIESADLIGAAVERYATLETMGWKGVQGTALGPNNTQGAFYKAILQSFARFGHAAAFELWFDDCLVASRLVISSEGTAIVLKTTYNESFEKYAPGRLLLRRLIEHLFTAKPKLTIEFYTNANADQLAWATDERWVRHSSLHRNVAFARADGVLRACRHVLLAPTISKQNMDATQSVEVYQHPDEFPADVVNFFDANAVDFESTTPWYRNLTNEVFKASGSARFLVLRDAARPIAALPICLRRKPGRIAGGSLSNYYTALYAPILARNSRARDLAWLLAHANASFGPLASFRFEPMDPNSRAFAALTEALALIGFVPFTFFGFGNWHLPVAFDWAGYLKGRSANLRSTVKRMSKKFAEAGGTLELIADAATLQRGMDAFQRVYSKSWKVAEPYPNFVPGLAQACAEAGHLRLGLAWLGNTPVAAQFWIVAKGKASIYKVAYDEGFKEFSPGTLVTAMLMTHVVDIDPVEEVDFLIGDDAYKKTWMSHRRERWGIVGYNARTLFGLAGLIREGLGRLYKAARAKWAAKPSPEPSH